MNFDEPIDRLGTRSTKWDAMEQFYGIPAKEGLPMWVADMDFRAPDFLQDTVREMLDVANYGYFTGLDSYFEAIQWWMKNRHGWDTDTDWMLTTWGLGNAIAMSIQTFTQPDDTIVSFTPVYHEFAAKIAKTGRKNLQLPLMQQDNGTYFMDFDVYDSMMTGAEKMVLFSAPHNPAGRVWTVEELRALADFCERHDLLLVSDEIHHDLVLPGFKHVPMHVAAPQIEKRLIMMASASKTFNIAGARTGACIIPNADLRERLAAFQRGIDQSPNLLGINLTRAAYSPQGAAWVDQLLPYLAGNVSLFESRINAIPGLSFMPMQSTYLAWVDFAGTGMEMSEFQNRVKNVAKIAATPGQTLGKGGETFLRFNLGTQRAHIEDACDRLADAFSDLQ